MSKNTVLYAPEAEAYVQSLVGFDLTDVGSPKWLQQHEYLEKLNMQALCSAYQNEDEYVKEFLVTHEKMPQLVFDAVVTDVWKCKIFPRLLGSLDDSKVVFPFYFVLHHEVTVMNLLETILYHQSSCEALGDSALDLLDYCYGKVTKLIGRGHYCEAKEEEKGKGEGTGAGPGDGKASRDLSEDVRTLSSESSVEELRRQNDRLDFAISLKSLTVLRFLIDNSRVLPLAFAKRLLNTLDVPSLLVELIENPPWICRHGRSVRKYDTADWLDSDHPDFHKLSKLEGQVWIALFQLLVTETGRSYEFTGHRRAVLLRLRPHLTDFLLDQLPVLIELQRFLDRLSFQEPERPKSTLVVEQLPQMRDSCLRRHKGKWDEIAERQRRTHFDTSGDEFRALATRLSDTYSFDNLENFIDEPARCAQCGDRATKRCSRCQNEWYCRRECQVRHWPKHKKACDLMQTARLCPTEVDPSTATVAGDAIAAATAGVATVAASDATVASTSTEATSLVQGPQ